MLLKPTSGLRVCICLLRHFAASCSYNFFLLLQGSGLQVLLKDGVTNGMWDQSFADKAKFSGDPVVCTPDVAAVAIQPEVDEFVVIATDGLWDAMPVAEAVKFAR